MRPIDVSEMMTRAVYTVLPEATVSEVAKLLVGHAISALPVCDASGALVGIISEGDLLRPFTESKALKRASWLNLLAEGSDLAPEFLAFIKQEQWTVGQLMTHRVVTTTEAMSLSGLAELLTTHHIKRVPVLRDGRLVGIVSRSDIVRAIA
ncbi:CBS domain-containing protein [Acidisoma cladoniae]|jgi:CBS domain-containing protein|uniref:CBS domain-containing protein n=1 Tax=Acidisoma cladoniae TaxID=3040935 RepID=UPI00254CBF49|nr:CBS domain-containing protein [Acidisoma sp. PAMC 29798]